MEEWVGEGENEYRSGVGGGVGIDRRGKEEEWG